MKQSSLSPYRVLDLTDENGLLASRILADLGADTIAIEAPGGNHARRIGPFYHDIPHPEKSLLWYALNSNKRGITLDITSADGRDIFKKLVKTADFLFESYPPGYLKELGLDYEVLSKMNPGLVMTSITPFGQTGPWRDFKSSDLVEMSLGGLVFLSGEPGKQPLRIPVPQIYFHAGAWAAAGAMIALTGRTISGEGQYVDVSMLEAAAWSNYSAAEWWSYSNLLLKREGTWRQQGLSRMRLIFDCKDGYVLMFLLGGTMATIGEYKMVEWMEAEGKCPDWLRGFDWAKLDVANVEQQFFDDLADAVAPFLLDKTKKQLFDWAMENELFLAPVNDTGDLLDNPQLKSREFWADIEHNELNETITYPGPFVKMSETPVIVRHRAPLIGEHNIDIYRGELGISTNELITLKQAGII